MPTLLSNPGLIERASGLLINTSVDHHEPIEFMRSQSLPQLPDHELGQEQD